MQQRVHYGTPSAACQHWYLLKINIERLNLRLGYATDVTMALRTSEGEILSKKIIKVVAASTQVQDKLQSVVNLRYDKLTGTHAPSNASITVYGVLAGNKVSLGKCNLALDHLVNHRNSLTQRAHLERCSDKDGSIDYNLQIIFVESSAGQKNYKRTDSEMTPDRFEVLGIRDGRHVHIGAFEPSQPIMSTFAKQLIYESKYLSTEKKRYAEQPKYKKRQEEQRNPVENIHISNNSEDADSLKVEIQRLRRELKSKEHRQAKIEGEREKIKMIELEKVALLSSIEKLKNELRSREAEVAKRQRQYELVIQEVIKIKEAQESTERELQEERQRKVRELNQEDEQVIREMTKIMVENQILNEEGEKNKQEVKRLKLQIGELKNQVEEAHKDNQNKQEELNEVIKSHEQLMKELQSHRQAKNSLEQRLGSMLEEHERALAELQSHRQAKNSLEQRLGSMLEELERTKFAYKKLQSSQRHLTQIDSTTNTQHPMESSTAFATLSKQLQASALQSQQLCFRIEQLERTHQTKLFICNTQRLKLQQKLSIELSLKQSQIDNLRTLLHESTHQFSTLQLQCNQQLESKNSQINDLNSTIRSLEQELYRRHEDNKHLKQIEDVLEQLIKKMHQLRKKVEETVGVEQAEQEYDTLGQYAADIIDKLVNRTEQLIVICQQAVNQLQNQQGYYMNILKEREIRVKALEQEVKQSWKQTDSLKKGSKQQLCRKCSFEDIQEEEESAASMAESQRSLGQRFHDKSESIGVQTERHSKDVQCQIDQDSFTQSEGSSTDLPYDNMSFSQIILTKEIQLKELKKLLARICRQARHSEARLQHQIQTLMKSKLIQMRKIEELYGAMIGSKSELLTICKTEGQTKKILHTYENMQKVMMGIMTDDAVQN